MAFQPILTPEDSLKSQGMPQSRTGGDVAMNLLASYVRKKKGETKRAANREELSAFLAADETGRKEMMPNLKNENLMNYLIQQELGGGMDGGGNVQSTHILPNNNLGYLTRGGKTVDTGVTLSSNYKLSDGVVYDMSSGGKIVDPTTLGYGGTSAQPTRHTQKTVESTDIATEKVVDIPKTQIQLQDEANERKLKYLEQRESSKLNAKKAFEDKELAEKQKRVWAGFEDGLIALEKSLTGTSTGWLQGKLPAFTTGQQIADSTVDVIFPTLKKLFREKGEGIFTDRDAIDLKGMLPTRSMNQDARKESMFNVMNQVRAKLGMDLMEREGGVQDEIEALNKKLGITYE